MSLCVLGGGGGAYGKQRLCINVSPTFVVTVMVYVLSVCCVTLLSGWMMPFPNHITVATTEELPLPVGRLSCVMYGIVITRMQH